MDYESDTQLESMSVVRVRVRFRASYNSSNQVQASEISRMDYMPSDMDILYADGITSSNGVAFAEFSFPQSTQEDYMDSHEPNDLPRRYSFLF